MAENLAQLSTELADLVESAAESVVRVNARKRLPATGIVWSENLIVTAHHAVEIEEDIGIGLAGGGRLSAKLIGRDPRNDLALLQVTESLTPANYASEDGLRVGNLVLALARPRQQIKASFGITSGLVNPAEIKRRRKRMKKAFSKSMGGEMKRWDKRTWRKKIAWEGGGWGMALADGFIQTDVIMYPGFSGGPLLGADGLAHGMNTSGFRGGVSAAVSVAVIGKTVAALLAKGRVQTGYLGVGVQTAQLPEGVAESLGQEEGLLIVSVEIDSPAAQAGMLVGDILTALDDVAVEHVDELQVILSRLEVGGEVKTRFVRGGEVRDGSVAVGEK